MLKDEITSNDIHFRFFLTLDYWFKMDDVARLLEDNHHLKKTLRTFYKSDLRIWFFNEKHLKNPSSKNYGGFHRHILIEDAPSKRWKSPTSQLKKWMSQMDVKDIRRYQQHFSEDAFLPHRMGMLHKVVKDLHHSTPNGSSGLKLIPIHNIDGLLSYCTKQNHHNIPHEYVIDTHNSSGLDNDFIRRLHAFIRHKELSETTYSTL